jgi:hypothetical protein
MDFFDPERQIKRRVSKISAHQESRQYTRAKIRRPIIIRHADGLIDGQTIDLITMNHMLPDNGCKRMGIERRQFSYTAHIPERRSGKKRRS